MTNPSYRESNPGPPDYKETPTPPRSVTVISRKIIHLNRHLIPTTLSYLSESYLQIRLNMCNSVSVHLFTPKIQKCETNFILCLKYLITTYVKHFLANYLARLLTWQINSSTVTSKS